MSAWTEISAQISSSEGISFAVETVAPIGGGCINRAHRVEGGGRRFFVKLNSAPAAAMFEAEAAGLQEILATGTLRALRRYVGVKIALRRGWCWSIWR